MQKKSYAEQVKESQVILGGVMQHKDNFIENGYTTEKYILDFETLLNATIKLNNDQEKSKAVIWKKLFYLMPSSNILTERLWYTIIKQLFFRNS